MPNHRRQRRRANSLRRRIVNQNNGEYLPPIVPPASPGERAPVVPDIPWPDLPLHRDS